MKRVALLLLVLLSAWCAWTWPRASFIGVAALVGVLALLASSFALGAYWVMERILAAHALAADELSRVLTSVNRERPSFHRPREINVSQRIPGKPN